MKHESGLHLHKTFLSCVPECTVTQNSPSVNAYRTRPPLREPSCRCQALCIGRGSREDIGRRGCFFFLNVSTGQQASRLLSPENRSELWAPWQQLAVRLRSVTAQRDSRRFPRYSAGRAQECRGKRFFRVHLDRCR